MYRSHTGRYKMIQADIKYQCFYSKQHSQFDVLKLQISHTAYHFSHHMHFVTNAWTRSSTKKLCSLAKLSIKTIKIQLDLNKHILLKTYIDQCNVNL